MGKDSKKHKRKSKEHKKRHKKASKHRSSSDDTSSSEEEWVECGVETLPPATQSDHLQKPVPDAINEHDEWASNPALIACTSRDQLRKEREKKNEKNEQDKYMLDNLGRTDRELNPYWKDGGCGLPEENPATVESLRQSHTTVGDQGAAWLRKALQRAKEQAQDSGRSLAEVVAERWGSLEKLESMISAAEERDRSKRNSVTENFRFHRNDTRKDKDRVCNERDKKLYRDRDSRKGFSKPRDSSEDSSDDDKKYRSERGSERKNKSSSFKGDRGSHKEKSEENKRKFKRVKGSSESSDDSVEEHKNMYSKKKQEYKSHKKISKHHSSSTEDDEGKYKKCRSNDYEQQSKSKKSHRGFSKPANSSDEEVNNDRGRRGRSKETSKELDVHKSSNYDKRKFVRPRRDSEEEDQSIPRDGKSKEYKSFSSSSRGWKKKVESQKKDEVVTKTIAVEKEEIDEGCSNEVGNTDKSPVREVEPVLTDKEMNELGAKLVKAELLGNVELAEELKSKLAKARAAKANGPKESDGPKEVVILTHTDAKGFTRPVSLTGHTEPSGGRRKGKKVETHADGKRMRYFADDDKYSLQDMFQREKLSTVEDSNEVFAKLASKGIGRDDSARDMEDVFEETARVEENEGRQKARERQKAVEHSRRTARTLDHCQWCLESQQMLKHLIVAIGNTCYLCVPPYQSLTDYHCLIVPRAHTPCATQLDEDVWAEVQDFRKAVVQMFISLDEDVVFFESARHLNKFPHMVLNCVPVPKETGDMAPIYFKKAIQECEQEWSNNKKLVELKGRDVRRAVPKGLPYFAVDFGLDSGYAHVIEDEQLFPQNFAQEIIGGMLDLDHSIWRKQRRQTFEEQSKKVIQLSKLWSPYDITKKK